MTALNRRLRVTGLALLDAPFRGPADIFRRFIPNTKENLTFEKTDVQEIPIVGMSNVFLYSL